MGQLSLALLGSPAIRHDGQVVSFPTRKTAALLIYVAVEPGRHSRDKLAALFWPDGDADHSRGSLRRTLSFLNAALGGDTPAADHGPHVVGQQGMVGLAEPSAVELDLDQLEAASSLARGPAQLPAAQLVSHLQPAARLVRGDFLEGFSLGDAPEFEQWVALQRAAMTRRNETVLDRLSEALSDTELGAQPAAETEVLAQHIRSAAPPARDTRATEAPLPVVAVDVPLVGRAAEHGQLVAALRAVTRGGPRVVSIEGEPGIGKTRLISEFLRWASAHGADVLHGRAFEAAGRVPYQPLVDALRPRVERENAPEDLLSDVWLAELSRLLPELRERYPDLVGTSGDEAAARTRLFEAVARLVLAFTERAPVVLWLDDLQWADAASRDLLQYASRRWAQAPVLLLLCFRSDDLATTPALTDWLASLAHELPLLRLALRPLSFEETDRLVRGLRVNPESHRAPMS